MYTFKLTGGCTHYFSQGTDMLNRPPPPNEKLYYMLHFAITKSHWPSGEPG